MKTIVKVIFRIVLLIVGLFLFLLVLVLPELVIEGMDWLAIYIGEPTTWLLFIGAIVLFVKLCNYYGK
jgi:hypothetical protein